MPWAGTNNDLRRVQIDNLLQRDLVVPVDCAAGTLQHKELVDIPGKRVVVIDQDDIGARDSRTRVCRNRHSDDFVGRVELVNIEVVN